MTDPNVTADGWDESALIASQERDAAHAAEVARLRARVEELKGAITAYFVAWDIYADNPKPEAERALRKRLDEAEAALRRVVRMTVCRCGAPLHVCTADEGTCCYVHADGSPECAA